MNISLCVFEAGPNVFTLSQLPMAILDHCELLALLRMEEKKTGEEEEILKEEKLLKGALRQEGGEGGGEEGGSEKEEENLLKEALRQASLLGDSALYRCHKKCARIKQLTGGVPRQ